MYMKPLTSIVIPTYNHAHFLKEALQSVIEQTYENWEAIVVNNYSLDNTVNVVNEFKDSRIILINYRNHGIIASARNKGISVSKGEYIAFLDSDDIWYKDKLQQCVDMLNKGYDLVCHGEYWITNRKYRRKVIYGPEKKARYRKLLFNGNCLSTSATMLRKSTLDKVGFFSESPNIVTAEDYDLWLRIARNGASFGFINSMLGEYRIHSSNNSKNVLNNMMAEQAVIDEHFSCLREFGISDAILTRRRKSIVLYSAGRGEHANQNYIKALHYYLKSWLNYPFLFRLYIAVLLTACKCIIKY